MIINSRYVGIMYRTTRVSGPGGQDTLGLQREVDVAFDGMGCLLGIERQNNVLK